MNVYHPLQSFYQDLLKVAKRTFYQLTYAQYYGKGFVCNFCNASHERFVPEYPSANIAEALHNNAVIAGYGENVFCPACLSKNRERLLKAVFENDIHISNLSILHFSPEKNLHKFLAANAAVTTVDLMPGFYRNIEKSIAYADATALQFENEKFDMVVANHILEHIPDDHKAMREIYRVLKKGGIAILQVPFSQKLTSTIEEPQIHDPARQERLYGQKDHVRIYAIEDYIHRLTLAGFRPEILSAEYLSKYASYAIQAQECVFMAKKSFD